MATDYMKYCEYFDICGTENKASTKEDKKIKKNDFYELAKEEAAHNG